MSWIRASRERERDGLEDLYDPGRRGEEDVLGELGAAAEFERGGCWWLRLRLRVCHAVRLL